MDATEISYVLLWCLKFIQPLNIIFINGWQYETVALQDVSNLVTAYQQLFYIAC